VREWSCTSLLSLQFHLDEERDILERNRQISILYSLLFTRNRKSIYGLCYGHRFFSIRNNANFETIVLSRTMFVTLQKWWTRFTINVDIANISPAFLSHRFRNCRPRNGITHIDDHLIKHFDENIPHGHKRLFRNVPAGRANGDSRQHRGWSGSVLSHPSAFAGQSSSLLPVDPARRIWNLQWHKPSIYNQQQLLPVQISHPE